MHSFEWTIEDIIAAYPQFLLDDYATMAVALMKSFGRPCDFDVHIEGFEIPELSENSQFTLSVTWNTETDAKADRMLRSRQRTPIVEGAAIALAMLLLAHLIQNSELVVTTRGDRADFWLPKLDLALEISGTERYREMKPRLRQKKDQVLDNTFGSDGYVIVCCFEESHRLIQWSYHSQPG
jgi:hypothetical protein